ncbi:MAG: pseudouridine synthase [Oscillospiraceae bacterium]
MLHKPAGVVSSTQDPRERTVLDLLPQHLRRRALFPVGRLDKDTEGLLLLTNDGPLAHALWRRGGMWTRSTMWRWAAGWTSRTGGPFRRE